MFENKRIVDVHRGIVHTRQAALVGHFTIFAIKNFLGEERGRWHVGIGSRVAVADNKERK